MSLRARLTLLFTAIVVGILLLFGVAVYVTLSASLTNAIDNNLQSTASQVIRNVYVGDQGELNVKTSPEIEFATDSFIQVWDRSNNLRTASANVRNLTQPLNGAALQSSQPVFDDLLLNTENGDIHLRVLTVPLVLGDRPIGAIQIGTSLAVVDAAQQSLIIVLAVGVIPINIDCWYGKLD